MGTVGLKESSTRADTEVICILRFEHEVDGLEDGNIAYIKHRPCQDLLQRLQNYEWNEDNVNPFEIIPDEDTEMEDIAELQIDQEDIDGTEDIDIDVVID